jgi:hypothetical protein
MSLVWLASAWESLGERPLIIGSEARTMEERSPPAGPTRDEVSTALNEFEATQRGHSGVGIQHRGPQPRRRGRGAVWADWFREDFLRSCFVGGSLAWDGLGTVGVRYALDPYYPGQESSPVSVYLVMLAFFVASVTFQFFLYRRWWPDREASRRPDFGLSRRGGASAYTYWNALRRLRRGP